MRHQFHCLIELISHLNLNATRQEALQARTRKCAGALVYALMDFKLCRPASESLHLVDTTMSSIDSKTS